MKHATAVPISAAALAGIELFRTLPGEERTAIAARCHGRRYDADEQILSQKDKSRIVYFIVSGFVHVTFFSRSGKEIAFRDQGPGEMFGELSAIDDEPRSAEVLAHTDVMLASLDHLAFHELLHRHPALATGVMQHLSRLVRQLSERVVEFSALGVNNRIHAELLRLARKSAAINGSARIEPVPTHAGIASRISTHREAVTRELNRLENSGLLRRTKDAWVIPDIERLHLIVRNVLGE